MQNEATILSNLPNHYTIQVMRAFGNVDPGAKAIQSVAETVKDIYRYFEPTFFKGNFYVCKHFNDTIILDEKKGTLLYDKNILLNKTDGLLIIQVFDDNRLILWENEDPNILLKQKEFLVYHFNNNKEYFFANENKIDATLYSSGSRFAPQYKELVDALQAYSTSKIFHSSCSYFSDSWSDGNRLFFKGAGSGNNIPEKHMQISLHEYLNTVLVHGISMESSREYNTIGDFTKPKPVDVKVQWRDANRAALIEVKFVGTIKKESDGEIYSYKDDKANKGIVQLKGYHDAAKQDSPNTILKSYLVVIDGRRNNLSDTQTTINHADGMHFKDVEVVIDNDKKFFDSVPGFEKPIKMFAAPICV